MNKSFISLLKEYPALAGLMKREALDELLEFSDAEISAYREAYGENQRAALRFLADAARRKKSYTILKPVVIKDVDKLLKIEDDKARKLAAVLTGICAADECADKLAQALKEEKTRFVRPSLILALGNTLDPKAYLKDYIIEPGELKHVKEEAEALKKALSNTKTETGILKLELPEKVSVTFISKNALLSELNEKKLAYSIRGEHFIDIAAKELKILRCYDEALYYLGSIKDLKQVSLNLNRTGCSGHSYRIESGHFPPEERKGVIEKISSGLSSFGYTDNPSSYSFEIRALRNGGLYAVFSQDDRFTYRIKSISASINPVTAASVMQICKPYFKNDAQVLDPFCGSGTMLIERAMAGQTKSLLGTDNSTVAIKAAIANRKASGIDFSLLKTDILEFKSGVFDEVISNMPFGNRVSNHEQNIELYNKFVKKLDTLLKPEGTAFLYTQEKKLLTANIKSSSKFTVVKEEIFESGGLSPTLFIIKRK